MTDFLAIDPVALIAVLAMALATYVTRAGGFWLMDHVAITPRIERFLRNMACGVLIAIVTASVVNGDGALWIGLAVIVGIMLALRRPMLALFVAVAATALLRQFVF